MNEKNYTLEGTITALVEAKKYSTLRDILTTMNPADIAVLFDDLSEEILPLLFRLLPKELAAETFVEMDSDAQEMLIIGFSDHELKEVIDELYVDDAVDIVEEMPANVVKRILKQADPEMRKMINELLKYPDDCAGSIMTTEFVELRPKMHVDEAIKHLRRTGIDKETINTCYVTNPDRTLCGYISIRTLIISDDSEKLSEIMEPNVISVSTMDDRETVVQMFSKYDVIALPVVDGEGRLVGIVTVDDAIDVLQEETTEDFEKMAAITPSEKPYLKTGVFSIWKSRIPWLMLLMISATFTGLIITHFESILAFNVVLTACIPMLMGTGGNSSSQASVTVIRGLSLDEIDFTDWASVLWKEVRVSALCGICLAIVSFGKMMLFDGMLLGNPDVTPIICLVVSITLAITVIMAKLIGCSLPILARKIGFDPAVMASPLITTLVDALSLLVYCAVATAVLGL